VPAKGAERLAWPDPHEMGLSQGSATGGAMGREACRVLLPACSARFTGASLGFRRSYAQAA
jgi:hypothetical protein